MRRNASFSGTETTTDTSVKQKDSWSVTSFERSAAACCYSVGSFDGDYYKPSSESDETSECSEPIDGLLGLTEDYFSRPEGYFGLSTTEELEMAIESCKEMIMETPQRTEKWRQLVRKLTQLRKKYQEIKEGCEELPRNNVVLGHQFELGSLDKLQQCERCCGLICGVVHSWYYCQNCGFQCHGKCMKSIIRVCALTKVSEKTEYVLDICPEVCLSQQKYRCAECKRKFIFKDHYCLPRVCDYSGRSYCTNCHWNNVAIIPARVVHNWDFTPKKVCQASLQFLRCMYSKPVLNVESLNHSLFGFVPELRTVKKLRQDILIMKQYFMSCRSAQEEKLLLHLRQRQHFVETADMYSVKDLVDAESGVLLDFLENVHSIYLKHITEECQGCQGKGFICEFCKSEDVLFPFYMQTHPCSDCNSLFHQECHQRWSGKCPKCARRGKQKENHPE